MSDMPTPPQSTPQPSKTDPLRKTKRNLADVIKLMTTQSQTLKKRGLTLPTTTLDDLRKLKRQIDTLSRASIDGLQELQSLRSLAETTALINSSQSQEEVLNQVMDTVIALTGAERGYIMLKNRHTGDLQFHVARGINQSDLDESQGMIISRTIVNRVADTGEPVLTDNASQDERYQGQDSIVGFALRSILAVPLKVRDDIIGVVYCDNRVMEGLFKQHELTMLNAFANQAAVAIENARLFESARLRLAQVSQTQTRIDNLFTSVASGIITFNSHGQVLISNAAAEDMLNNRDLGGHMINEVLPPIGDDFADALRQAYAGDQVTLERLVTVDGRGQRFWKIILSPLRDVESGQTFGVAMVLDDLTEQRTGEEQIKEVRRYLPLALVENFRRMEDVTMSGQEREITALFADVRGFTSFSESLEPEELMTVINKYLSLASDAINLFEGIVDKYMGDAVTGLFNTQLNPQPDHAARAVQAALQLVLDLHAQHEVLPEDQRLYYGIGIHTGPAFLGNVGGRDRKEFAAIGEAQDIAKYLQEQAGPGQIVVSQATYTIIEDTFICEPIDEPVRPKKGFEDLRFYRVLRRKKGATTGSLFVDEELLALLGDDD